MVFSFSTAWESVESAADVTFKKRRYMLQSLHIKNFALIEEEEITFLEGLHILSGETGAGKSILLGALGLALGAKAEKGVLRDEDEEALVEAVFRISRPEQRVALEEMELPIYDDEVILTRRISATRSVAKINGESIPAARLKEVGNLFLDIHGQHEHQSLLSKKKHLELIDEFAGAELAAVKSQVKEAYAQYSAKEKELTAADLDPSARLREISFLEHEIAEIEGARIVLGEDEILEADYKRLANGKKILEAVAVAFAQTGEGAAADGVSRALRELMNVSDYDPKLADLVSTLTDVDSLLSDANRQMSDYLSDGAFDSAGFEQIEGRLNAINRLKDKYGRTLEDVLAALAEKQERVVKLKGYEDYLAQLKEDLTKLEAVLESQSQELSTLRQATAKELCAKVTTHLQELNFLDVRFTMEFAQLPNYTANGFDDPEFVIGLNPGEPMGPLKDVASGGEMSRIMLAIKTVLAENDGIDTLIFDEIDSGISGRTAQAVSEKLALVAKKHQVICITHLPQIAAMADQHYLIEKDVVGGATLSSIQALPYHDSIKELARMLGGRDLTQAVLDNAKEMKELALATKENL